MTWPNIITIARILLVPVTVWLIISEAYGFAFLAFVAAGVSDAVDGYLARRLNLRSELGAYLDPIADKALLVSIYVTLGFLKMFPAWLVIAVELLFAPLALWRRLRFPLWFSMLLIQFGFLVFLDFADLTAPMLLAQLLTFDPRWIRPGAPAQLLFDGQCGFCHGLVRFALIEDTRQRLRFASLQSQGHTDDSNIVLIDASGSEWRRSDAVIGVLRRLGGYWWLLAQALRAVPRALRDAGYDAVGRLRYRLGARLAQASPTKWPIALERGFSRSLNACGRWKRCAIGLLPRACHRRRTRCRRFASQCCFLS